LHCGEHAHCQRLASDSTRAECYCDAGYHKQNDVCVADTPTSDCSCPSGSHLIYNARSTNPDIAVGCARDSDGLVVKYLPVECGSKAQDCPYSNGVHVCTNGTTVNATAQGTQVFLK
jgi:hypothetical protein